jgi:Mg-chelatase subunit ChlI
MPAPYPFTAILGQEPMQTALLLSAVDPAIGGVLVRGQKGTAKSTAARALATLLPEVLVVSGCPYRCDPDRPEELHDACRAKLASGEILPRALLETPFVDLPLSTTEDRLVGTLHLEHTLLSGQRQFEPGLLAAAHRGILYVDEVNLLPDHLVDMLLDAASSGWNQVEREGLQFSHAARFILIGTMNPEEGELRPQFLDRFGLCVTISGLDDMQLRSRIVTQRLAYDRDPSGFRRAHRDREEALRQQVANARKRLEEVTVPAAVVDRAVVIASAFRVQGHRAELALVRAARALAALLDHANTTLDDLAEVAGFALAHRCPGPAVLSQAEIDDKLSGLLKEHGRGEATAGHAAAGTGDDDDLQALDDREFPGAAAAGSRLFSYLKKKSQTATSAPTNPST